MTRTSVHAYVRVSTQKQDLSLDRQADKFIEQAASAALDVVYYGNPLGWKPKAIGSLRS